LAWRVGSARRLACRPSSASTVSGVFCSAKQTWNSGLRLKSRLEASFSTSFSKGTSWYA